MKTIFRFTALLIVAVCSLTAIPLVTVAADEPLTEAQLTQISNRCSNIQTTLARIHANDAVLRVNQGQLYDKLSTKLMAPLNSRIALNRLDGSDLVAATNSFEIHLGQFRSSYQNYEESLSKLMRIDCAQHPASFYTQLEKARGLRDDVRQATSQLGKDMNDYKKAFNTFAKPYKEGKL